MRVSDFDYQLPQELIAQQPAASRDQSRLLVLDREANTTCHTRFCALPSFLRPGDLLVLNDTKVIPARLQASKETGGKVEVLLVSPVDDARWHCLVRPARRVRSGALLHFAADLWARVTEEGDEGMRVLQFSLAGERFARKLEEIGTLPLPPYIKDQPRDPGRYQTVYASRPGAVAAPTAGLHFTPRLFARLEEMGVRRTHLTLHVGLGTFRPVAVDKVAEHKMHSEYYEIPMQAAQDINRARQDGGRIVAVGTTVVRVLETAAAPDGSLGPGRGWTDIFIYPGHRFRAVDALITNFHLPRSTLLMLVSAFAGREQVLAAYREAVARQYRFFSFGDAMLIL